MKVNIIIIAFNSQKTIISSLSSTSPRYPLFVIDNGSADATLRLVIKMKPSAKIIQNKKNLGFARAVNQGIKMVKSKYVLLLNPDTKILDSAIRKMAAYLDKNDEKEKIAALGPKILNPDGRLQPSFGRFPNPLNVFLDKIPIFRKYLPTYFLRHPQYYQKERRVDWLTGACLLIRKKAFAKVGLFDEGYFMYGEDIDWCYRAQKAGYVIKYYPQAAVIHYNQGRSFRRWPRKIFWMFKGFWRFWQKSGYFVN